jgi:F0F1-type ATP synthase beta subunit
MRDLLSQWMGTSTAAEIEALGAKFLQVESSNLAAVSYNLDTNELDVAFLDGSVYRYYQVPLEVANGLMDAPSHGSYFYWNIRESYSFERIIG